MDAMLDQKTIGRSSSSIGGNPQSIISSAQNHSGISRGAPCDLCGPTKDWAASYFFAWPDAVSPHGTTEVT
jgi:hypothetical protein